MTPKLSMRKQQLLRSIHFESGRLSAMSVHADDITVILPNTTKTKVFSTIVKEHDVMTGAKINPNKTVRYLNDCIEEC